MTGGRCSEVDLVLELLGRDIEWSLLTGGHYSEVVVNTGLTVFEKKTIFAFVCCEAINKTEKNDWCPFNFGDLNESIRKCLM